MSRPPQVPLFRGKNIIKELGELCLDALYQLEDCDYEFDDGYLETASCGSHLQFGSAEVNVSYWYGSGKESVEVEIYKDEGSVFLNNLADAVEKYCNENLDAQLIRDYFFEQAEEDNEDEWQRNGFRDAADYYHWRYG